MARKPQKPIFPWASLERLNEARNKMKRNTDYWLAMKYRLSAAGNRCGMTAMTWDELTAQHQQRRTPGSL